MAREIRGWNIGEVVTANEMTLNSANIYEETGSNGEANLPCIYNGLTLQSQAGTGNSIVTFNPGVCRCQDLPTSTYTYLPSNAYGTGYPCYIDISTIDSNTVITLTTSPTTGYIVATFSISPVTSGAVNYVITGSLLQIATGSYNPAIHVRLCSYNYTGSTFVLDFTPGASRDTDFTGIGGINWNYQNSSLEINTPASQSGTSVVVKQPLTAANTTTLQNTAVIQSANAIRFNNSGNTHYTSLQGGATSSNVAFILPTADASSSNQFITSNLSGQLSFASPTASAANIAANDSNVTFVSSDNHYQVCTPTAARTYTMPSVLAAGVPWTFINTSTTATDVITIQTSGSNTIDYVVPNGYLQIIPLTSTPTTASNWLVVEAFSSPVAYTPTFTGLGTCGNIDIWYSRRGGLMKYAGYFEIGTPSAVLATMSIPGGFTLSSSFTNPYNGGYLGSLIIAGNSVNTSQILSYGSFPDLTALYFGLQSSSQSGLTPLNGNSAYATGTKLSFVADLVISGWKG